jgi:putative hydrolase of the HAD superfamily
MNSKIKAVVFDAGGVITDWRTHIEKFAAEIGKTIEEFYKAVEAYEVPGCKGLIDSDEYCRGIMKDIGLEQDWKKLRQVFPQAFTPIEETYRLLEELNGRYRLAMLTNATKYSVDELDKKIGHKRFFEVIVDSSVVGMVKPDKEIYLHTCRVLKLKPQQCVFVDDLLENIEAAENLGFHTVHFTQPKKGVAAVKKILGLE